MSNPKIIYGFHAVTVRLRQHPKSMHAIYLDGQRQDGRMRDLVKLAESCQVKVHHVDRERLTGLTGNTQHQGVVAQVDQIVLNQNVDDLIEKAQAANRAPVFLILDGIQDPHNLGACLRVADVFGVDAIIAPKDKSVGVTPTVAKVASGAAETVPYIMVTNLARTLRELKDHQIWVFGADMDGTRLLNDVPFCEYKHGIALVLGAEGAGLRKLTKDTCDELISIPMFGHVESLNVSVASGICLYEVRRTLK